MKSNDGNIYCRVYIKTTKESLHKLLGLSLVWLFWDRKLAYIVSCPQKLLFFFFSLLLLLRILLQAGDPDN